MKSLYLRLESLVHELAKFGLVGGFCFALDIGLFNLLRFGPLDVGPLTSKAVSTTVAATASYFLNRHWTFSHRARTGVVREYRVFIVLSAVGLLITEACLVVSHYLLGLHSAFADNVSANGVGLVLGTTWRFWAFKRWVFLPVEATSDEAARDAAASAPI